MKVSMTHICWSSDFALYLEDLFDVWTSYFRSMIQYDRMCNLKINVGHCDLYFITYISSDFAVYLEDLFDVWSSCFGIMS